MQKKDDKVGNKPPLKKEKKRAKEKDRKVQMLAFAHAWKMKKLFNYVRLVGEYALFLTKLVFRHSYAN